MSFKIGDKFVIEIDRIYSSKKHEVSRYGVKGFANFVLDDKGINRLLKRGCIVSAADYVRDAESIAYQDGCRDGAYTDLTEEMRADEHQKGYEEGFDVGLKENIGEYQRGMDDAWYAARELVRLWGEDDDQIIINDDIGETLAKYSAKEVYDKVVKRDDMVGGFDRELYDWCNSRHYGCDGCIMRKLFHNCGNGWHICYSSGNNRKAIHKIVDAMKEVKVDE